jgi:Domain of unknown function (DUF6265)
MTDRAKPARRSHDLRLALALSVTLAVAAVVGQLAAPAGAASTDVARAATAADLGWMAGCWISTGESGSQEECWVAPAGGVMLGVHRDVSPRGTAFEFLRIADEGDGLIYFASPSGRAPTPFRLVELGDRRAVFANLEHDFPQRVLYWIEGERLRARADGVVGGETRALDFSWESAPDGW